MIYLSVDVEASGPFPGLFNLVSIGAAVVCHDPQKNWIVDQKRAIYIELKPIPGACELEAATHIHGLSREYLMEYGEDPSQAMAKFAFFFKDLEKQFKKVTLAAWPSSFDAPFIGWYLQRFTGDNPTGWSAFDIPSFAMGVFCCQRNAVRNLMKKAGIEFGQNPTPHNALADAIEQGQTLASLLNYARTLRKNIGRQAISGAP